MGPGKKKKARAPPPPSAAPALLHNNGHDTPATTDSKAQAVAPEQAGDSTPKADPVVERVSRPQATNKLLKQPTLTKESTVIKSGLVKVAYHRLGMNHWRLRNMELCWDPIESEYENTCKVQLRLTIFPAKRGQTHKRTDIPVSDPQSLQIASQQFVNRNVLLIQSDVDYYISTDNKEALVDWVATLKAALAKKQGGDNTLFFITILPGQSLESGEALFSIVDNSLLLQKPVHEEMFYMSSLSSVVAFGSNQHRLTWWLDVFPQRRKSMTEGSVQHYSFFAVCVDEVIACLRGSILTAGLEIEEVQKDAAESSREVHYKVLHPERNDLARIEKQQLELEDAMLNASPHIALAEAKVKEDADSPDGQIAGMPRRITWSGLGRDGAPTAAPPQHLIKQLRSRQKDHGKSQSVGDLSQVGTERDRLPSDSSDGCQGKTPAKYTPGGVRIPPSRSPPSSPPPAPPELVSHLSSPVLANSQPPSPSRVRRPQKPPRHETSTPQKQPQEDRSGNDIRSPSPIYSAVEYDRPEVAVDDEGVCIVVPQIKKRPSLEASTMPGSDSLALDKVKASSVAEDMGTISKRSGNLEVPKEPVVQTQSAPGGLEGKPPSEPTNHSSPPDATDRDSEPQSRPVPKPRRRTKPTVEGLNKADDTGKQPAERKQSPKGSSAGGVRDENDTTAESSGKLRVIPSSPEAQERQSWVSPKSKPAVPLRKDSITAPGAVKDAAAKAVMVKNSFRPSQEFSEHHDDIYENVDYPPGEELTGNGAVARDTSPSLPPRKGSGQLITEAPGHGLHSPVATRGPPDGQEADSSHSEVYDPYEDDDEPIYVNLANCRLPTVCDSGDELG